MFTFRCTEIKLLRGDSCMGMESNLKNTYTVVYNIDCDKLNNLDSV